MNIPEEALEWRFVRASGPGGQNVNKVSSAVQLRLDLARSGLTAEVRRRLLRIAGGRISQQGVLIIDARRHRTQERNRQDALERLRELLAQAAQRPKRRIATRPTLASKRRRIEGKKKRGATKRLRGRGGGFDD